MNLPLDPCHDHYKQILKFRFFYQGSTALMLHWGGTAVQKASVADCVSPITYLYVLHNTRDWQKIELFWKQQSNKIFDVKLCRIVVYSQNTSKESAKVQRKHCMPWQLGLLVCVLKVLHTQIFSTSENNVCVQN